jgi:V/A-type H+/Na+-transporting ATPase subunit K
MIKIVIVVLATLIPVAPVVMYFLNKRSNNPLKSAKDTVLAFKAYNLAIVLMAVGVGVLLFAFPDTALAAGLLQEGEQAPDIYASLAAGISVGLGSVGAGIAVSGTGAAAIGAVAEKPDFLGRSLIFVGLAEGIAIYGLLIAFLVLFT